MILTIFNFINKIMGILNEKRCKKEKYGRILADVYIDNIHINKWMLDNKYAIQYNGGTKNKPPEWESEE